MLFAASWSVLVGQYQPPKPMLFNIEHQISHNYAWVGCLLDSFNGWLVAGCLVAGCVVAGWVDGWIDGWVDGWVSGCLLVTVACPDEMWPRAGAATPKQASWR